MAASSVPIFQHEKQVIGKTIHAFTFFSTARVSIFS